MKSNRIMFTLCNNLLYKDFLLAKYLKAYSDSSPLDIDEYLASTTVGNSTWRYIEYTATIRYYGQTNSDINIPHGNGILYIDENDQETLIMGRFENGLLHGKCSINMLWGDDHILIEGTFDHGRPIRGIRVLIRTGLVDSTYTFKYINAVDDSTIVPFIDYTRPDTLYGKHTIARNDQMYMINKTTVFNQSWFSRSSRYEIRIIKRPSTSYVGNVRYRDGNGDIYVARTVSFNNNWYMKGLKHRDDINRDISYIDPNGHTVT